MDKGQVAEVLINIATLLELKGENPFKISAYRKASRIIGDLTQDIEEIAESGKLKGIPGFWGVNFIPSLNQDQWTPIHFFENS